MLPRFAQAFKINLLLQHIAQGIEAHRIELRRRKNRAIARNACMPALGPELISARNRRPDYRQS